MKVSVALWTYNWKLKRRLWTSRWMLVRNVNTQVDVSLQIYST